MSRPARLVNLVALAAGALLVFALGFLAARCEGEPVAAAPDGGVRLLLDAGAIELLPDASLHIEPLPGWDAGEAPR